MNVKHMTLGTILAASAFASQAAATYTAADSTFGAYDAAGSTRTLTPNATGIVSDVALRIDFAKCDDPALTSGTACASGDEEFAGEIYFYLLSPSGTRVDLVYTYDGTPEGMAQGSTTGSGTYDLNVSSGGRFQVIFDDQAGGAVGPLLASGSFMPVEPLALFNGENAAGNWVLGLGDSIGADPLSYFSACLAVTTDSGVGGGPGCPGIAAAAVPEPGSLPLSALGLGAAAAYGLRRRQRS